MTRIVSIRASVHANIMRCGDLPAIFSRRTWFAGAVALMACAGQAHATEARYTCGGGAKLTARFSPPSTEMGSVALTFATGETIVLPQAMSADGGRYADKGVEFWIKGDNATLTRNGGGETCSTK